MREILFRGERADNGDWETGFLIGRYDPMQKGNTIKTAYIDNGTCFYNPVEVIPETVGQYTGLTDKNGKKMFEGDIVTGLFLFGRSVNGVVAFRDGSFGLLWYRGSIETFNAFTSMCNIEYKVIGNIHDNPELLTQDTL